MVNLDSEDLERLKKLLTEVIEFIIDLISKGMESEKAVETAFRKFNISKAMKPFIEMALKLKK